MFWASIVLLVVAGIGWGLWRLEIRTHIWIHGRNRRWMMGLSLIVGPFKLNEEWSIPLSPAQSAHPAATFDLSGIPRGMKALAVFVRIINELWIMVSIERFSCALEVGLADAASTALLVGLLSTVIGSWVQMRIAPRASNPEMSVYANWEKTLIDMRLESIMHLRVGHVIHGLWRVYAKKGGRRDGYNVGRSIPHAQPSD